MAEPVRHRQTKGAATDMFDLQPPRHTSTLPNSAPARRPQIRDRVTAAIIADGAAALAFAGPQIVLD